MGKVKKIAITGPESCGKSTLTLSLAEHFKTTSTVEFARTYMEKNGSSYNEELILYFIEEQIKLEKEASKEADQIVFCDTDMINFKIWLTHEGYSIPKSLAKALVPPRYEFNLLLKPNIPWVSDKLRQFPSKRDYFFNRFEEELMSSKSNFKIIDEKIDRRLDQSIGFINTYLKTI